MTDELDAFLAGAAGAAESPAMRSSLKSAAQHFPVAGNDRISCEDKYHVGAKRLQGMNAVEIQWNREHLCPKYNKVMSICTLGSFDEGAAAHDLCSSSSSRDHPARVSVEEGLEDESGDTTLQFQSDMQRDQFAKQLCTCYHGQCGAR